MSGRLGRRWLLAALALLLVAPAVAATPPAGADPWSAFDTPWFSHVGTRDGLPHSVTTAVVQDRRGMIWIGTMGGLVRYDGYHMVRYGARGDDGAELPDSYVRCLLALPGGGVLVGTNAGGLARFEPRSGHFHLYPVGPGGTSDRKIYDLALDPAGGAWLATDHGIDHLDLAHDTISRVTTSAAMAARNFSVMEDRAGDLWVGNDHGLFVRRAGHHGFVRPRPHDAVAARVIDDQVWALYQDRQDRIWAGSGQAGAAYRGRDGHWHAVPHFSGYVRGARRPTVRALLQVDDGSIWIGTDGAGIIAYRPGDTQVRRIDHDPARMSSLPGDSVRALLEDASGNRWAATDVGVARSDARARTAFTVQASPLHQRALASPNVHAVFVDSHGRVWLGLGTGHVDMIDPGNDSIRHLHMTGAQARRNVQAFAEAADGGIWVGGQGVRHIDPRRPDAAATVLPALDNRPVLSLLRTGPYLLIGTYEGVYRYDRRNGTVTHFHHRRGDPGSLASDTVRQIVRIGDQIWYATTDGISIAADAAADGGFRQLRHRPNDPGSLPQDYVGGIVRGADGRIWVSTFGGLAVLDHYRPGAALHFRTIGRAQGLDSSKINAVVLDRHGNPWVSMSNGIARIDARRDRADNLGIRDGQHISGYISIAAASSHGDLLFGGLGGLTVVRPDIRSDGGPPPRLAITQAVINGRALPQATLPRDGQPIDIGRSGRSLRLDFALLDYRAPTETAYSFRMAGFDPAWTDIPRGTPPAAIYSNLPHGHYMLELRAATSGMHPRVVTARFPVTVRPLWFETLPFRLAVAALVLAAVLGLVHLRTLYLRRQAQRLQELVDARTRDLQAANRRLDQLAGTDSLTGLYNRRRFLELAGRMRKHARPGHACMALLDLDRFKRVNDTYGHLAGDAVIRTAAEVLRTHCSQNTLVARFGGEELVACLPDITLEEAMATIERVRATLAREPVVHRRSQIRVTASIGVAALREGESLEQWLSRADDALYLAKRNGRNRCAEAS